jgi:hypothetical protein
MSNDEGQDHGCLDRVTGCRRDRLGQPERQRSPYAGRPVTAYLDVTGAGDAPYRVVSGGVGVVFQLGFTDERVPASTYRP